MLHLYIPDDFEWLVWKKILFPLYVDVFLIIGFQWWAGTAIIYRFPSIYFSLFRFLILWNTPFRFVREYWMFVLVWSLNSLRCSMLKTVRIYVGKQSKEPRTDNAFSTKISLEERSSLSNMLHLISDWNKIKI